MTARVRITITGIVQGVGFRPHVYRLAREMGLRGYVTNTSKGVLIEVEGEAAGSFASAVKSAPPPLAEIKTLDEETFAPAGYESFEIRLSQKAEGDFALVSPDIAACGDCISEMLDPSDRRHGYPFINCTNCGPRYSIVLGVPYDRPLTTMKAFGMCPACRAEYDDPADRRFHAQPTACADCGPRAFYIGKTGDGPDLDDPIGLAAGKLKAGRVLAVKGLGGFHLACDARSASAVRTLRKAKRGNQKPFAVMAPDVGTVRKLCHVSAAEEALLAGRARPIVLLRKKPEADVSLSPDLAPGNGYLGFMLPYTPLHCLLFERGCPGVLVMTSGNMAEEPIVTDNEEALVKLVSLAGGFLMHDRDIYMRVDDSVARVTGGVPRLIRRARGYVPEPMDLGRELPEVLACGGELKNTLCLTKSRYAIISQHIGDLESYEALEFFRETLQNLKQTFNCEPSAVAHDMHPEYMSTKFALEHSVENGLKAVPVQHHHAHIASCMAENGQTEKVIGVALDGTGYGTDGNIWGSEFLVADLAGFERFAHMAYVPLPGGDKAVREPWRQALSFLVCSFGKEYAVKVFDRLRKDAVQEQEKDIVLGMLAQGINSPLSCGMGRLFDAVSSLCGLKDRITYEGEAAIALEMAAGTPQDLPRVRPYGFELAGDGPVVIDSFSLVRQVAEDLIAGASASEVSLRFHVTVAEVVTALCSLARDRTGIRTAALSGGVFQNGLLFSIVERGLMDRGFRVLTHSKVPPNDGCISLGQAAVAASLVA